MPNCDYVSLYSLCIQLNISVKIYFEKNCIIKKDILSITILDNILLMHLNYNLYEKKMTNFNNHEERKYRYEIKQNE